MKNIINILAFILFRYGAFPMGAAWEPAAWVVLLMAAIMIDVVAPIIYQVKMDRGMSISPEQIVAMARRTPTKGNSDPSHQEEKHTEGGPGGATCSHCGGYEGKGTYL